MAFNTLILQSRHAGGDVANLVRPHADSVPDSIQRLARYLAGYGTGAYRGELTLVTGSTRASGTITFTDQPSGDEGWLIGDQAITAKASGASGDNEYDITSGGTAAEDAAANATSLGALINAHPNLSLYMTATVSAGVVTVTIDIPGEIGNGIRFAEDSGGVTNATISGLTGGTDGTETVLSAGGVS